MKSSSCPCRQGQHARVGPGQAERRADSADHQARDAAANGWTPFLGLGLPWPSSPAARQRKSLLVLRLRRPLQVRNSCGAAGSGVRNVRNCIQKNTERLSVRFAEQEGCRHRFKMSSTVGWVQRASIQDMVRGWTCGGLAQPLRTRPSLHVLGRRLMEANPCLESPESWFPSFLANLSPARRDRSPGCLQHPTNRPSVPSVLGSLFFIRSFINLQEPTFASFS
jgi:hypothetical protein